MAQGQTFSFHTTHTTQLGKKQKLFYTTTPLYLIQRLIRTLCPSITNEQYLNTMAQGSSIPEQTKLFLLERCHNVIIEKWILLFKYLMTFHSLIDMGKLFYEALCDARLRLQYLELAIKTQNYFLYFNGQHNDHYISIFLEIFKIIKIIANYL